MAVYSIKDLENFTKIKAHTLRIWEQRYNLLNPKRTETNIRYYSDHDLKKILNINLLYKNGLKISKIADLSEKEIIQKAEVILNSESTGELSTTINKFVRAITTFDEKSIAEEIRSVDAEIGLERMFTEVLVPLLQKIGELWQVNTISVAHEHFFSNILRAFLLEKTNQINIQPTKESVILFLREGEYHELGLLFYHYLLKKRGYHCHYLGQSLPVGEFQKIASVVQPAYVFTSLIAKVSPADIITFLDEVLKFIPSEKLYVGGIQACNNEKILPNNIRLIQTFEDIDL